MSEHFRVDPDAVKRHAGDLSELMGHIRDAAQDPFRFDPQTYGAIGAAWTWALNGWTDEAIEFINKAADAGDRVSEELVAMADDYREQDGELAREYELIFQNLEEKEG